MSIAVLMQVQDEVRRLAIAGSAVASGDFRLKKLVAPLEQAAAKAPVFGKVAQATQAVVESNEKNAAMALLDLATLVNAILYTQGETGVAGELSPLATTDLGTLETQTSARVLKPLLDALTSTGSGRVELVKDAIERGTFRDLRLVRPALAGLDDPYAEIGELIASKVLPMYGQAIVPELRATLDLKGRGGHLHRLRLLHALDPEGTRETVREALDEGSKEMRVVAIECLSTSGSDLGYLLEQSKAKAKDVRAAALRALVGAKDAAVEAVGAIKRAIDGGDVELLVSGLRVSEVAEIRDYVLAQAEKHLTETLAIKDAKTQGPAIERLQHLARSLDGRQDGKAEAFLMRCYAAVPAFTKIKSTPSGQDFNETLVGVMVSGTAVLKKRLVADHASLPVGMLEAACEAGLEILTPGQFFAEFSPTLSGLGKKGKRGAEYERAEVLARGLRAHAGLIRRGSSTHSEGLTTAEIERVIRLRATELDPRWLDAAIETGSVELVCALARPKHAKVNTFLSQRLEASKSQESLELLQTMVRIEHPDATDAVIDSIKKQAKTTYSYLVYWYGPMITALPKSAVPKLEALLPTLPDKILDELLEPIQELKNRQE